MSTSADALKELSPLDLLPPELRREIVFFLRDTADRTALALTNQNWNSIVLPILWNKLSTDLTETVHRRYSDLTRPGSNILAHLQRLRITRIKPSEAVDRILGDHLVDLLTALPSGQLRAFEIFNILPEATMQLLMQLHPAIEVLDVPGRNAMTTFFTSPSAIGTFSNLRTVNVYADSLELPTVQALLDQCPNLHTLHVGLCYAEGNLSDDEILAEHFLPLSDTSGRLKDRVDAHPPTQLTGVLKKVRTLHLDNASLRGSFDSLFRRIDVSLIHTLRLDRVINPAGLLIALTSHFKDHPSALRVVRVTEADTDNTFVDAVNGLLSSIHGLSHIWISSKLCGKLDVDGIVRHGDTLETLMAVTAEACHQDRTHCFTPEDFSRIAEACPKLEQLCINIYGLIPGNQDASDCDIIGLSPNTLHAPTEFEAAITAIVSMKQLQIMCITDSKSYQSERRVVVGDRELAQRRYAYQARADGMMQYLAARGSNIKILAFSPVEGMTLIGTASQDRNGHKWPNYWYCRGRVMDGVDPEVAVARPLKSWEKDFPGSKILENFDDSW